MATSKRGFASLDPEKRRVVARKGGQAAHAKRAAHEFTPQEAREAGRKGGKAVSRDRAHMALIGRKGGLNTPGYKASGYSEKDTDRQERRNETEARTTSATAML